MCCRAPFSIESSSSKTTTPLVPGSKNNDVVRHRRESDSSSTFWDAMLSHSNARFGTAEIVQYSWCDIPPAIVVMTAPSAGKRRHRSRVMYSVSAPDPLPADVAEMISQAHARAILSNGSTPNNPGQHSTESAQQSASASSDGKGEQSVAPS